MFVPLSLKAREPCASTFKGTKVQNVPLNFTGTVLGFFLRLFIGALIKLEAGFEPAHYSTK